MPVFSECLIRAFSMSLISSVKCHTYRIINNFFWSGSTFVRLWCVLNVHEPHWIPIVRRLMFQFYSQSRDSMKHWNKYGSRFYQWFKFCDDYYKFFTVLFGLQMYLIEQFTECVLYSWMQYGSDLNSKKYLNSEN